MLYFLKCFYLSQNFSDFIRWNFLCFFQNAMYQNDFSFTVYEEYSNFLVTSNMKLK